jgi:hypothetical protein
MQDAARHAQPEPPFENRLPLAKNLLTDSSVEKLQSHL